MPRLGHSRCLLLLRRRRLLPPRKSLRRKISPASRATTGSSSHTRPNRNPIRRRPRDRRMGRQGVGAADDRRRHRRPAAPAQLTSSAQSLQSSRKSNGPAAGWRAGPVGTLPVCRSHTIGFEFGCQAASRRDPTCGLYDVRGNGWPSLQALPGHLSLPRLRAIAEPCGTVRWGHASAPLSVAPMPVPTGIREPALAQAACRRAGDQKDNRSLQPAPVEVNP